MLTRREIMADYRVENGFIRSPGKFEHEPIYAPYYYDMWMECGGAYDEDAAGNMKQRFDVYPEDRAEFPELASITVVILRENDNGFVYTQTMED